MIGMFDRPDPRRVARLTVPRHLRGGELELHLAHVLDLSPLGARITHLAPLHEGVVCYVDLPPALGRVRLTGRVVWTRLRGTEQTLEGERRCQHESGIEFTNLTPDQQTALVAALATLQAAQNTPHREGSR